MAHPLQASIEAQIREANARGELNDLPGSGRPLDLSQPGPSTLRKIMREAEAKPPAVAYAEQARDLRKSLAEVTDTDARRDIMKKIADLDMRANIAREGLRRF